MLRLHPATPQSGACHDLMAVITLLLLVRLVPPLLVMVTMPHLMLLTLLLVVHLTLMMAVVVTM